MIHEKVFRERLSFLIEQRGIKPFLRKTRVSETSINQFLHGECFPTLKILEAIALPNDVSVAWLIGEESHLPSEDNLYQQEPDKSMQEIQEWISTQRDGINYWEILKAKLSQEYPDFKNWLEQNNSSTKPKADHVVT